MKVKVVPKLDANGNVSFVGKGRKTADVQQIKEWFTELEIATDWTRFGRVPEKPSHSQLALLTRRLHASDGAYTLAVTSMCRK